MPAAQFGEVTVYLVGDFDISCREQTEAALKNATRAGHRVALDLSEVAFIDAAGLRPLVECVVTANAIGGRVRVSAASPFASRVLELAGLTTVLGLQRSPVTLDPVAVMAHARQVFEQAMEVEVITRELLERARATREACRLAALARQADRQAPSRRCA